MKAIIFDCDGTLVDTEMAHYAAWVHALKKYQYHLTLEEYSQFVGTPVEKASHIIAQKLQINCAEDLKNQKHAHFRSKLHEGVAPIQGTFDFLQKLIQEQSRHQYKLAIASGASKADILTYLRHLKVEEHFEVILSGKDDLHHYRDPEGTNKPKPYIYLEAAKQLGLHPSECVAIEDSHPGVMSGVRAGCITVAIPTPFSINHDFSASNLLIPSLSGYTVDQFIKEIKSCQKIKKSNLVTCSIEQ